MNRIAVLGGAGAMGQVIVRDLVESKDVDKVVIADFNQDRAKELASAVGPRPRAVLPISTMKKACLRH